MKWMHFYNYLLLLSFLILWTISSVRVRKALQFERCSSSSTLSSRAMVPELKSSRMSLSMVSITARFSAISPSIVRRMISPIDGLAFLDLSSRPWSDCKNLPISFILSGRLAKLTGSSLAKSKGKKILLMIKNSCSLRQLQQQWRVLVVLRENDGTYHLWN